MSATEALAIILTLSAQGTPGRAPIMDLPPADPQITIADEFGGGVSAHALRVMQYDQAGTHIRLTGRCVSACTLILALPPDRICVTPTAAFGFHLPSNSGNTKLGLSDLGTAMEQSYPRFVQSWLDTNYGGLPPSGSNAAIRYMRYDLLKSHYRTCG